MPLRGKGGGRQGTSWGQCQLVRQGDLVVLNPHAEPGRSQVQISYAGARIRGLTTATRSSLGSGGRRSRALAGVPLTPPCAAGLFLPGGPISWWRRLNRERASALGAAVRVARRSPRAPWSWSVLWSGAPEPRDAVSDKLGIAGGRATWDSSRPWLPTRRLLGDPERPAPCRPADPGPARGGGPGGALSPAGGGGGGGGAAATARAGDEPACFCERWPLTYGNDAREGP